MLPWTGWFTVCVTLLGSFRDYRNVYAMSLSVSLSLGHRVRWFHKSLLAFGLFKKGPLNSSFIHTRTKPSQKKIFHVSTRVLPTVGHLALGHPRFCYIISAGTGNSVGINPVKFNLPVYQCHFITQAWSVPRGSLMGTEGEMISHGKGSLYFPEPLCNVIDA